MGQSFFKCLLIILLLILAWFASMTLLSWFSSLLGIALPVFLLSLIVVAVVLYEVVK